jgi:hypothetical protein
MLYRFLINYVEKLYNGWINVNLSVIDAINLRNVSFKNYNYYEYEVRPINANLMKRQIYLLQSTKIFTAKNTLNGGVLEYFINHIIFDVPEETMNVVQI